MTNNLSYQSLLKREFENRVSKNPQYSLRAFARFLEIAPAQLSRVLNGKKNISASRAIRIAELLFKSEQEQKLFVSLVELETRGGIATKKRALERVLKFKEKKPFAQLGLDMIKVISDWYHIAILDLTMIDGFRLTPLRAASKLGISFSEATLAIGRLRSLQLLKEKDGKLVKASSNLHTPTDIPSEAIKKFHKQMIAKGAASLDEQPTENRYIVGKTFAVSKTDIPKLKSLIEKFRTEVSDLLDASKASNDSLYQLNVQLFELTLPAKGKSK